MFKKTNVPVRYFCIVVGCFLFTLGVYFLLVNKPIFIESLTEFELQGGPKMSKQNFIVVKITCPSKDNALKIKDVLLEKKLAACINIVSGVDSYFWWKGKIEKAKEVLMFIKTKEDVLKTLIAEVKKVHKYTVPEIIALPIVEGNKDYLDWIVDSLSK